MNRNIKKIVVIIVLIILFLIGATLVIVRLAPNYCIKDIYTKGKINLIINNKNVTQKLKYDLFIDDKDVIYMSKEDIKNYFDQYIIYDETNNQIITTYENNIGTLQLEQKTIKVNDETVNILSGLIKKDGVFYLPISELSSIYNLDIKYAKESKILLLDSLSKELVKADITQNTKVKYKTTALSKTIDKVKKGDKLVVLAEMKNNWTKVRTENGFIGYVKSDNLESKICVREDKIIDTDTTKINLVWDYFSEYAEIPNRNGTTIEGLNVVSPSFFSLVSKGEGKINTNIGNDGISYINWAKNNNYEVWAMFSNNSYKETTSQILNSYETRTSVINNIAQLAKQYNLDGINIDFENMNTSDKDVFSRFIIELKPKLRAIGVTLSVDVTPPDGGTDWSECYDRNVIGDVADYIVFMAYDQYGGSATKAGTTAGYNWVETNLKKFIDREEIASNKIILGIPFYTRLWTEYNGTVTSKVVNMNSIDKVLPDDVQKEWNDDLKQYYVEYTKNGRTYKMWIEDEESIKNKISLVTKYNLAGVAAWEKDRETQNIWSIINQELNEK